MESGSGTRRPESNSASIQPDAASFMAFSKSGRLSASVTTPGREGTSAVYVPSSNQTATGYFIWSPFLCCQGRGNPLPQSTNPQFDSALSTDGTKRALRHILSWMRNCRMPCPIGVLKNVISTMCSVHNTTRKDKRKL